MYLYDTMMCSLQLIIAARYFLTTEELSLSWCHSNAGTVVPTLAPIA